VFLYLEGVPTAKEDLPSWDYQMHLRRQVVEQKSNAGVYRSSPDKVIVIQDNNEIFPDAR
jgi:hypothetical protein